MYLEKPKCLIIQNGDQILKLYGSLFVQCSYDLASMKPSHSFWAGTNLRESTCTRDLEFLGSIMQQKLLKIRNLHDYKLHVFYNGRVVYLLRITNLHDHRLHMLYDQRLARQCKDHGQVLVMMTIQSQNKRVEICQTNFNRFYHKREKEE